MNLSKVKDISFAILIAFFVLAGIYLRFYHIEFGLPHSFHADEPEFTELAIKYTYEFKDIVSNNNWYKLIPVSFVYGTLPSYLLTGAVMAFSKFHNLANLPFEKTDLFIFMRQFSAVLSLILFPIFYLLYKKLFGGGRFGLLALLFLLAFNWKLIVHAHYVNADIVLTVLMGLVFLITFLFMEVSPASRASSLYLILLGLVFGFAVGTKITALISLPLFFYVFYHKKDLIGGIAFLALTFCGFVATNPFSIVFAQDFAFRVYSMLFKEGGLVFDSVDTNPFKYVLALVSICSIPVVVVFVLGLFSEAKKISKMPIHIFLLGHVAIYLLFYSIQSRLVDRWLLPIVPIVLVYSAYYISRFIQSFSWKNALTLVIVGGIYLYYPSLLLFEYGKDTPKSSAYLWSQKNMPVVATKLVITEEGLDPMNKLPMSDVRQFEVYESDGAQFVFPPDPLLYDYVVLSSKPLQNFKRKEVVSKFPYYVQKWQDFENIVLDQSKFELVNSFVLPKPNLVNLSDVFVYQKKRSL